MAAPAFAQGKAEPVYAPPAEWVEIADLPAPDATDGASEILLTDTQGQLRDEGSSRYFRIAIKVRTEEGLRGQGQRLIDWDPEQATLTIHHLRIVRDGRTIDALPAGRPAIVARRETNLERATIDGRLAFSKQIDDLRVGDVIDFAYTIDSRNIAVPGREAFTNGMPRADLSVDRMRIKVRWPTESAYRWTQWPGGPPVRPVARQSGSWTELLLDASDVKGVAPPERAPLRYHSGGTIEVANYDDWVSVSRDGAALFTKARALPAGSPVRALAADIVRRHARPQDRVVAALDLVEGQVRYVAVTIGASGLVPASADETWARRFGDCKGKTALLLALLDTMGIEAEAALTSIPLLDVRDDQLPRLGAFNHVLVRAIVGGGEYWLDGTRPRQGLGLAGLDVPDWRTALPLRAQGAKLVRVLPGPAERPMSDLLIAIDATARDAPAFPVVVTQVYRDRLADGIIQARARATGDQFDRASRNNAERQFPWLTIAKVAVDLPPGSREAVMRVEGTADLKWLDSAGRMELTLPSANLPLASVRPRRDPAHASVPFMLPYPFQARARYEVRLPDGGRGYATSVPALQETIAGQEIFRASRVENGVAMFEDMVRMREPEVVLADAAEADSRLRAAVQAQRRIIAPGR